MPVPYANVSLITTGTGEGGARNFSYLRVLNPDVFGGGTNITSIITSVISSVVTSISGVPGAVHTFSNANNVSFGTAGMYVTATASYGHVAPAGSVAWSEMGVWVAIGSPTNPCQYSQWVANTNAGYWGWIQLP